MQSTGVWPKLRTDCKLVDQKTNHLLADQNEAM